MSWLFSRALVAAYSAASCSVGAPSAPSNSTPTPQAYCSPDKMKAYSRLSRFGMTFGVLTAGHGEALLTWFLEGSLARTFHPPAKGRASTAREAASGARWHESFARFDRNSHSWKTLQCSLLAGLDAYSETWPKWGMMRRGVCWELPTSARPMSANASGYSPATPRWPTPMAGDSKKNGSPGDMKSRLPSLAAVVKMHPTPQASDGEKWNNKTEAERKRQGHQVRLCNALSTPRDRVGGNLNPTWVEWLMGWPLGWTGLEPLATDRFRQWRQAHSSIFPL